MTVKEFTEVWNDASPTVSVHTSGSTGRPKDIVVEKSRMEASARATCRFLGLKKGDSALLCMSVDYIAGKMMVVRSIVWGLKLLCVEPSGHPLRGLTNAPVFAAMVPMQVYNSLKCPDERRLLMRIRHLLIGGGALDEAVERQLQGFPNAVWCTYGMTETLSHVALRRVNGPQASRWYTPFEGVGVALNEDRCLVIDAPYICDKVLTTNDICELASDGRRFRVIGRRDNVICSGGIKMQIEEIERRLKPFMTAGFMITKRKDEKFGEAVTLLVESGDIDEARSVCLRVLPKYEVPKHYISVDSLPMTGNGKPARAEAARIAEAMR